MTESVFICRKCGQCCLGRGGIVLGARDIARLAAHIGVTAAEFLAEYAELSSGKQKIRCASDGYCVFYENGRGCRVHAAKPDVCRAWPFFRGNLVDPLSLEFAKDYCAGIRKDASFEEFARTGREWLRESGIGDPDSPCNALRYPEDGEIS